MHQFNQEIPFLIGSDFDQRRNVAWRVELGEPDPRNPLIEPEMPWDDGETFLHGTVLRDPIDGLWKAWGTAAPNGTFDRRLVYYESENGIDWRRPELGIHSFGPQQETNIILDLESGGTSICANVFVDPEAPESRRYQMYVLRRPDEPDDVESGGAVSGFRAPNGHQTTDRGVYRYVSSDGVRWRPEVGPVLVNDPDPMRVDGTADGILVYRQTDGTYVTYHKTITASFPGAIIPYELGTGGCRVIVRRSSDDGVHWSPHEPCLAPDWRDPADTQFMELSVTPLAGGYIGLVTVYRTGNQTLEFQFAASRDGRYWWRPDRRACVAMPPLGDYGGGMMWGSHHLVEEGDSLHYYYGGMEGIHGDMFSTEEVEIAARQGRRYKGLPLMGEVLNRSSSELFDHGALCRATWRRGRLWALTTASGGNVEGFATAARPSRQGDALYINARTLKDGEILTELVGDDGHAVPGFGREACVGFSGDNPSARVTWAGSAVCPADGLRARFILRRAHLYGFEYLPIP